MAGIGCYSAVTEQTPPSKTDPYLPLALSGKSSGMTGSGDGSGFTYVRWPSSMDSFPMTSHSKWCNRKMVALETVKGRLKLEF